MDVWTGYVANLIMVSLYEFNKKWRSYLVEGFQGLDINNDDVVCFLEQEFEKEIKTNPNFQYKQIKLKCGACRIYASSSKVKEWEAKIDEIINSMTI